MKAVYLALCLMLVLAGTVMATWDDGYDDYGYGDEDDGDHIYYEDYGGAGCCCAPVFALLAVGAFAFRRQ